MSNSIRLIFAEGEDISFIELAQFLHLFTVAYRALVILHENEPIDVYNFVPGEGLLMGLPEGKVSICVNDLKKDDDPVITLITQQSPIEITISGSMLLFTMAAILSGGQQKIKLGPVEFQFSLQSLADSIVNLRNALSRQKAFQPGYGFIGATIKLSVEEYGYLCKYANMNGGFQRFLNALKCRIKKQTRELTLSNQDIERILRYKANPRKGGFQLRYKKIFGRHFD